MIAVIDASVTVKWFFPDPARESDSERALDMLDAIRAGALEPLQPPHWLAEVAAVVARLDPRRAATIIDLLDIMEFSVVGTTSIYKRAASIAAALGQRLFDTLYHAVALEHGVTLVTADRRYLGAAKRLGRIVHLADWRRK